jgi:hypothetical protein
MIGIDIIGTENVLKYIEVSKLSKFTIDANKSGHFICVFECINSNNNETAITEFSKWADFINPNQNYKITLFDVVEISNNNGTEKITKTKNKNNKMSATFILNENYNTKPQSVNGTASFDEESLLKKLTHRIVEEQSNNAILNEIKILSERLNRIELEEEEEEETENGIAGIPANQIEQIMGLVNLFKNNKAPAINGIEEVNVEIQSNFKNNINKALKILAKNNKNLDTDLLKLAEMSENKKETFNMLLQTLRNF